MAQLLLRHVLPYSKNIFIPQNQSLLLLKSSQIIYKPIIIRSIQYSSYHDSFDIKRLRSQLNEKIASISPDHTKSSKTLSQGYVNDCYEYGGKLLHDFVKKIETVIYENISLLTNDPICISFRNDNYCNDSRFKQFQFNGGYIISTFDKNMEKYFISQFPNLSIKFLKLDNYCSITITNYIDRDIILKKAGIFDHH
ncbi:hypothetical protein GLOIN_2v1780749 [Rhizophagus clarus]|uniref:Uncharacterized protein n=1 Tax=Rhizophagus clarus TaxID=94130 RepID=A0A8H3LI26_9GLOM|nr:hypothetical protein GLOIN_2v1780749 [Rhizophagus clarus]